MKLSTRGRYGIHAMFDLALQYSSGIPQPTKAIAERERIPDAYLEQLIATLDEVMNIQRQSAEKRRAAAAELGRIEGELKQKLLELRS